MVVVLSVLDIMTNSVIIAALGASAFVVFTMPHSQLSSPQNAVGGYLVGTVSGCICNYFVQLLYRVPSYFIQDHAVMIMGAISIGVSMFFMAMMDVEHAPAAGLSLGFVLNPWTYWTVLVVVVGIIALSVLKTLLKPWLVDLL